MRIESEYGTRPQDDQVYRKIVIGSCIRKKILSRGTRYHYPMAGVTAEMLREAAELLGIFDQASLHEIRDRFHERIREWHPDTGLHDPAQSHEMTIRVKESYDLLVDYCMNHPFSFRVEDLARDLEQSPADFWKERFGEDPIWG
jgi:hypothetical protein